jgi:Fic family protein
LAEAEGALGQLEGVSRFLPNPNMLIRPYLYREALSSTRIEGTQASLVEVLEAEAAGEPLNADVEEVINYVDAMEEGIAKLESLPMSTRLLKQTHGTLMRGVRGQERSPGRFRTSPNWIGPPGSTLETAPYVPPPPEELPNLLTDWENFANEAVELPLLVQDALLHSQFETIHPFLDGNGRLGRLVIVFFLIARRRLSTPVLYLSAFLEANRSDYYEALQAMRESGDATPWLELFMRAVRTQAVDAVERSQRILDVRDAYLGVAGSMQSPNAMAVVEVLCSNPIVSARSVETRLGVSRPTALRLLAGFEDRGVLDRMGPGARGQRRFMAPAMMAATTEDAAVGTTA